MSAVVPSQKQHIDALVLAFQYSKASELVGTDALRMVIAGQYRDMFEDGVLKLDSVWALLESQPKFSPALIIPPLCRFKCWDEDLGIEIELPSAISELSARDVRTQASQCQVPSKELDKILERGRFTQQERQQRAAKWAAPEATAIDADQPLAQKTSSTLVLAIVSAIAIGGFIVAGFFLFQNFKSTSWTDVNRKTINDLIPVSHLERHGQDLGGILSSDSWLTLPTEQRQSTLRKAIARLANDGVRTLFIRDTKGTVRAIAQLYGESSATKIRVELH